MTVGRYRAWRFAIPSALVSDPDRAWTSAGLQTTPAGRIEMVEEDASVRQAIMLLISTSPGERLMRPDYGCSLRRLIFAPNDDTTAGLAIHYVRTAIERFEPRVEIISLDAGRDPERPERLDLELRYRVRATRRVDELHLAFDLEQGGLG
ncbi:MAG: GPW/gp25 family protein [Candidatus Limnocylindrales bacterium]